MNTFTQKNKKVALMVATYNGEHVIEKCVLSLLHTHYQNKEIIVVNDGSTDGTEAILNQFGDRITVLQGNRSGVAGCRNLAMKYTDAEFIATTDDDCEADPEWIDRAMPYLHDDVVAAVTGEKIYKITNLISAVRSREYWVRYRNRKKQANSVECPVTVFRKSFLQDVGGFSIWTFVGGEDTDIGYKLKEAGHTIIFEPRMIVYHDPEESFQLYLKRNFRNAVAYVRVFSSRSKKHSLSDDFFPWYVLFQPFFTIVFYILTFACILETKLIFVTAIVFMLLNITYLNITKEVYKSHGHTLKTFFCSHCLLLLRNTVWLGGMVVGIKNLVVRKFRGYSV